MTVNEDKCVFQVPCGFVLAVIDYEFFRAGFRAAGPKSVPGEDEMAGEGDIGTVADPVLLSRGVAG